MSSIDRLPNELLVEIFKCHVWNNGTPQRLLRVSKRWYAVATSVSALWANILLCPPLAPSTYLSHVTYSKTLGDVMSFKNKVTCKSVASLVEAINRTKGSKLDLTFILPNAYTLTEEEANVFDAASFSGRCRALKFIHRASHQLAKNFNNLSVLKELKITGNSIWDQSPIISLLQTALKTAPHLHVLEFFASSDMGDIKDLSRLLPRIDTFHLRAYQPLNCIAILKAATSVKTLTCEQEVPGWYSWDSTLLDCPSSSLETLNLIHMPIWSFSNSTLSMIKHLYLHWRCYEPVKDRQTMELSNLVHLTLVDCWPAISLIRAPHLHTLKLHGNHRWSEDTLKLVGTTDIRPPTVDLNINITDQELKSLIWQVWNDVEDLQIVFIGNNKALFRRFASNFMLKAGEKRLCPRLRQLVILSTNRSNSRRVKSEESLREIAEERKFDGVLNVVRYGWYVQEKEIDNPRDCKIDWVEIL